MGLPQRTTSFSGQTPVALQGHPTKGPLIGQRMYRGISDWEHATLCRAFGLDANRFYFDLPSTVRGVGSSSGAHSGSRRVVNGYVMCAGFDAPVATITVLQNERTGIRGNDEVLSESDFQNLSRT